MFVFDLERNKDFLLFLVSYFKLLSLKRFHLNLVMEVKLNEVKFKKKAFGKVKYAIVE